MAIAEDGEDLLCYGGFSHDNFNAREAAEYMGRMIVAVNVQARKYYNQISKSDPLAGKTFIKLLMESAKPSEVEVEDLSSGGPNFYPNQGA